MGATRVKTRRLMATRCCCRHRYVAAPPRVYRKLLKPHMTISEDGLIAVTMTRVLARLPAQISGVCYLT